MNVAEGMPLLPRGSEKPNVGLVNNGFVEDQSEVEEGNGSMNSGEEDKVIFSDNKKRGTKLIWSDFLILTLEYIQMLAMIQSMALRWPWPNNWLQATSFVFVLNADVWELAKLYSNETYKSVQDFYTESSKMPFHFYALFVSWGLLLLVCSCAYLTMFLLLKRWNHPFLMVQIAMLQRVFIICLQVFALPVGMNFGKVFHCSPNAVRNVMVMDVDNALSCFHDEQWAYAAVAMGLAVAFFIVCPVWLIYKVRRELIFAHSSGHEAYLQLKETEYVQGLDVVYIVSGFHVFSSFRLKAAHFRAAMHFFKFSVIIIYAALFSFTYIQAVVLAAAFLVYFISMCALRPFRVYLFNLLLCVNAFCLLINALTGAVRTSFDAYSIRSIWFTPTYMAGVVFFVNAAWLAFTLAVLIFLLLNQTSRLKRQLWPSMTSDKLKKLDDNTKKFMRAVLKARHLIERSMRLPPLFAPAHELSLQVQIINAYCREAEILDDPLQDTLWHLLDELIEVHSRVGPKSLFAESVKDSIRTTAKALMKIMPAFVERLAQREYDMLLVPPVKRRLLFKLYCLGTFLNFRSRKKDMSNINKDALNAVWTDQRPSGTYQVVEYLPELQPRPEFGPRALLIDTSSTEDLQNFSDGDDVSIDISIMMMGIPSRPMSSQLSNKRYVDSIANSLVSTQRSSYMPIPRTSSPIQGGNAGLQPFTKRAALSAQERIRLRDQVRASPTLPEEDSPHLPSQIKVVSMLAQTSEAHVREHARLSHEKERPKVSVGVDVELVERDRVPDVGHTEAASPSLTEAELRFEAVRSDSLSTISDPYSIFPDQPLTIPDPPQTVSDSPAAIHHPPPSFPDQPLSIPDPLSSVPNPPSSTPDPPSSVPDPPSRISDPPSSTPPTSSVPDPPLSVPDPPLGIPDAPLHVSDLHSSIPSPTSSVPDQRSQIPDQLMSMPNSFLSAPDSPSSAPDPPSSVPDTPSRVPDPPSSVADPPSSAPDPPSSAPDPPSSVPDTPSRVPDPPSSVPDPSSSVADP